MSVKKLYVKRRHGAPIEPVAALRCEESGILDNVPCAPFRQVLIASQSDIGDCGLLPGDLRENVIVEFDGLYDLPSGTVVRIGSTVIRLTFHCEPCKKILKLVDFDRIVHRRGVFGSVLKAGTIALGDAFAVADEKCEPIPYSVKDRMRWFLSKQHSSGAAVDLVYALGLPATSASSIPRLLQKIGGFWAI